MVEAGITLRHARVAATCALFVVAGSLPLTAALTVEETGSGEKAAPSLCFDEVDTGTLRARNLGMGLDIQADRNGLGLSSRGTPELKLRAAVLEDATGRVSLPAVAPVRDGCRASYPRGPVTEWYVNRTDGLEQGFTILNAADGSATPPATTILGLTFNAELTARIERDGRNAAFHLRKGGRLAYHYDGLKAWDADGTVIAARLENGGERTLRVVLDTAGATYPVTVDPLLSVSTHRLTLPDGAANDGFGRSLSAEGDVIVVGSYADDDAGSNSGSAFVFERNLGGTNTWAQACKLTASDAAAGAQFGRSVSVAGDVAVIGAYGHNSHTGSAYVFERNIDGTNAWGEVCKLTASDAAADDYFGYAVAVAGDVAVVGAYNDDDGGNGSGSAYVFERNAGGTNAWSQVSKLTASDGAASDYFGYSVAVGGDTAVIGAVGDGGTAGAAYVYQRNVGGTNAWGQVCKLTASDAASGSYFGCAVAVAGDVGAVGAESASLYGAAYVFERNIGGTNAWGQVCKLLSPDDTSDAFFGKSVSLEGDVLVVGAPNAQSEVGEAYVYERNAGGTNAWGMLRELPATNGVSEDMFGYSVAALSDVAVIGAYGENNHTGAVYVIPVFESTKSFQEEEKLTAFDAASGDRFGNSVTVAGDVAIVGAHYDSDAGSGSGVALEQVRRRNERLGTGTQADRLRCRAIRGVRPVRGRGGRRSRRRSAWG